MSNETIRYNIVKTRKPHRCLTCTRMTPKGAEMVYWVGKFEGDFQAHYTCKTCSELIELGDFSSDEGYTQGCVAEYLDPGQTPEDLLLHLRKKEEQRCLNLEIIRLNQQR